MQLSHTLNIANTKRKQTPDKPGSVSSRERSPVIYLLRRSPYGSSVLPSIAAYTSGGQPSGDGLHELAASSDTARRSPAGWWSLTPPSHPYQTCPRATVCGQKQFPAVILFCLTLLSPIASIFGSGVPYAARTFLSPHKLRPAAGPGICFPCAKIVQNMRY